MKIIFMGTPDFAKECLEKVYNTKNEIVAVVTVPDKPKGRGMKLIPCEVKEFALEKGLKVYQPEKLRNNEEIVNELKKLKPDVICVVAYGKIIPKEILEIPSLGCINVHPSMLPKYRGPAPIQWAVLNGDKETGVTTMYLDEGMDSGDIILQEKTLIDENETSGELWNRLAKVGAKLLVETLDKIEKNEAPRKKQPEEFTLAPMLEKEMSKIDWENKTATQIKNLVRGLNPIMGAVATLDDKKIKFWKVNNLSIEQFMEKYPEFKEYENKLLSVEPGTIVYVDNKQGIYTMTKEGILQVLEIQGENAKKMTTPEFLRGNPIEVAKKFE